MRLFLPLLAGLFLATPSAIAQQSPPETTTVTTDFDLQVRKTLLRHPEIILEVFDLLDKRQAEAQKSGDMALIIPLADRLFAGVEADTPVLVEFLDYRCGYCAKVEAEVLALRQAHPEIVVREVMFPILGEDSMTMAGQMLALKAIYGQEAFRKVQDELFAGNRDARADLGGYLEGEGFDIDKIETEASSDTTTAIIAQSFALARQLNVTGTPGFVTRTRIIRGFADADALAQAVFDNAEREPGELSP